MLRGMSVFGAVTVMTATATLTIGSAPLQAATDRGDAVRLATNVIQVPYAWFGDLSGMNTHSTLAAQLGGMFCQTDGGDTCSLVNYPRWGDSKSIAIGVADLLSKITATSDPKLVESYSLGGTVIEEWLRRYGQGGAGLPAADDLSFVMTGRPNETGSIPTLLTVKSIYRALDVVRQYDGVANKPDDPNNFLAVLNSIMGFFLVHTDYTKVDLFDPANTVYKVGNITYVRVPTEKLPLLAGWEWMRWVGLGNVLDDWNAALKPLVNAGYNWELPKGAVLTTVAAEFPELIPRSVSASLAAASAQRALVEVDPSASTNENAGVAETSSQRSPSETTEGGDDPVEEPLEQPAQTDVKVQQDQPQPAVVDEPQTTVTQDESSDEEQPDDPDSADIQTGDHKKPADVQDESEDLKSAPGEDEGPDAADDANKPSTISKAVTSPEGAATADSKVSLSGSTGSTASSGPDSAQ